MRVCLGNNTVVRIKKRNVDVKVYEGRISDPRCPPKSPDLSPEGPEVPTDVLDENCDLSIERFLQEIMKRIVC